MILLKAILTEISDIKWCKKFKTTLTPEEREEVMKADACWHPSGGPHGGKATVAIQVAKGKDGKRVYWCGTHRAWSGKCDTLRQAIKKFEFIKTTA